MISKLFVGLGILSTQFALAQAPVALAYTFYRPTMSQRVTNRIVLPEAYVPLLKDVDPTVLDWVFLSADATGNCEQPRFVNFIPAPKKKELYVTVDECKALWEWVLLSEQGNVLQQGTIANLVAKIELADCPPATYFIQVRNAGKIVKELKLLLEPQ